MVSLNLNLYPKAEIISPLPKDLALSHSGEAPRYLYNEREASGRQGTELAYAVLLQLARCFWQPVSTPLFKCLNIPSSGDWRRNLIFSWAYWCLELSWLAFGSWVALMWEAPASEWAIGRYIFHGLRTAVISCMVLHQYKRPFIQCMPLTTMYRALFYGIRMLQ